MAGRHLRVLEKNTFSVTAAQLPLGQVLTIPVAVSIPVSDAVYGTLILRCHAFSVGAGAGTAPKVRAFANVSAPTNEDPNTLYRSATATINGASIAGSATFTPTMDVSFNSPAGNLGGFMDVQLEITQWATTTAGNLSIMVSIDLILKS